MPKIAHDVVTVEHNYFQLVDVGRGGGALYVGRGGEVQD